jgi:hypothetical protein
MSISQTMFYGRLNQIIAMTEKSGDTTCLAKARALHDRMTSKYRVPDSFDDDDDESSPPSLLDLLADAMNSMDIGADDIHGTSGNSAKDPAKKPASKKPVSGDQMDFFL